MGATKFPHGIIPGGSATYVTANTTLTAATDSGKVYYTNVDGIVFTLPAIGSGWCFTFVNTAANGQGAISISPNSSDGIMYATSSTDDKDLINTKATHECGDQVTIFNIAGTDYWSVTNVIGVWAKES